LTELKSDSYSSFDVGYINKHELDMLINQNEIVGRLLNGLVKSTVKIKSRTDNR
jgi:hypothetical protein